MRDVSSKSFHARVSSNSFPWCCVMRCKERVRADLTMPRIAQGTLLSVGTLVRRSPSNEILSSLAHP